MYKSTDVNPTKQKRVHYTKGVTLDIGTTYKNRYGVNATIVENLGRKHYLCKVGAHKMKIIRGRLSEGTFKTPLDRRIYKTGFVGFGAYNPTDHRVLYQMWSAMLKRCYSNLQDYKSYVDCVVCEKWHNFQNFAKWCESRYVEGYQLDKDLKAFNFNGKLYSPDTCTFLPPKINNIITKTIYRETQPAYGGRYHAKVVLDGVKINLGMYDTSDNSSVVKTLTKLGYIEQKLRDYDMGYLIEELNHDFIDKPQKEISVEDKDRKVIINSEVFHLSYDTLKILGYNDALLEFYKDSDIVFSYKVEDTDNIEIL